MTREERRLRSRRASGSREDRRRGSPEHGREKQSGAARNGRRLITAHRAQAGAAEEQPAPSSGSCSSPASGPPHCRATSHQPPPPNHLPGTHGDIMLQQQVGGDAAAKRWIKDVAGGPCASQMRGGATQAACPAHCLHPHRPPVHGHCHCSCTAQHAAGRSVKWSRAHEAGILEHCGMP